MSVATLIARIRARRQELGLTQTLAAERAGLSQSVWARAEAGLRQGLTVDTLERMAGAVELRVVLEGDEAAEAARDLTQLAQELGDYD